MASYLHEVARRLVAFDTVSAKSNAAAAGYLADELARHGFRVACHEYETRRRRQGERRRDGRAAGRGRADRLGAHRRRAVRGPGGLDARAARARDRRRPRLGSRHLRHEGLPRAMCGRGRGARPRDAAPAARLRLHRRRGDRLRRRAAARARAAGVPRRRAAADARVDRRADRVAGVPHAQGHRRRSRSRRTASPVTAASPSAGRTRSR